MKNIEGDAMPGLLQGLCKVAEARKVKVFRNVSEAEMGGAHGDCWFTGENGKASKINSKKVLVSYLRYIPLHMNLVIQYSTIVMSTLSMTVHLSKS